MAAMAPPATASMASDSTAADKPKRALMVGICTPQVAKVAPLTKNSAMVARAACSTRRALTGAAGVALEGEGGRVRLLEAESGIWAAGTAGRAGRRGACPGGRGRVIEPCIVAHRCVGRMTGGD